MSVLDQTNYSAKLIPVLVTLILTALTFLVFSGYRVRSQDGARLFRPSVFSRVFLSWIIASLIVRTATAVHYVDFLTAAEALGLFELIAIFPPVVVVSSDHLAWHRPWSTSTLAWSAIATFTKSKKRGHEELLIVSETGERVEFDSMYYRCFDGLVVTIGQELDAHHNEANRPVARNWAPLFHRATWAAVALLVALHLHLLKK